jgi:hypothetical protein
MKEASALGMHMSLRLVTWARLQAAANKERGHETGLPNAGARLHPFARDC